MSKYVFNRFEVKYVLTPYQYELILKEIKNHLHLDQYGETTIQSLYFDTPTNRLIRNSIERPSYKEKIRLRSYGLSNDDKFVFLELKKKSEKVVFKRRIEIKEKDVANFIKYGKENPNQIEKEIIYFCNYYQDLQPSMMLLYDRSAYVTEDSDLRITFDKNTRYRTTNLNLSSNLQGTRLLPNGEILMEIKSSRGYPMWLVHLLNQNKAYKRRFSKYGTAYEIEYKKNLYSIEEEKEYV